MYYLDFFYNILVIFCTEARMWLVLIFSIMSFMCCILIVKKLIKVVI